MVDPDQLAPTKPSDLDLHCFFFFFGGGGGANISGSTW